MIELKNITKRYGHTTVVDDVTVSIPRGGITAIIGPNGAGKSTLLSIASRLMKHDAGTVSIDGDDISKLPSDVLARRISVLRQDNHLAVRLSVEDSPNSAGIIIDAIRAAKIGLDRGIGGPLTSASAYFMKSPPVQLDDDAGRAAVEAFIRGDIER